MASYNKVTLMGNLTRQPEFKQAGNSTLASLGLALNRRYKSASGEKREEVTYVDVTFWGKMAELLQKFQLSKGTPLFVDGRLQLDTWEDKASGQKRSKLRVVGETFQLLQPKGGAGFSAASPAGMAQGNSAGSDSSNEIDEDQIPF
jgi:single-strand DNA-binding protein